MCTLTLVQSKEGFELGFNRDELRTRLPETLPSFHLFDDSKCLMPKDSQAQGSWLGVNNFGIVVALMNLNIDSSFLKGNQNEDQNANQNFKQKFEWNTQSSNGDSHVYSRGGFVPLLLRAKSIEEAKERFEEIFAIPTKPCRVFVFSYFEKTMLRWSTGESWTEMALPHYLVESSSGMPGGDIQVQPHRAHWFEKLVANAEDPLSGQRAFHKLASVGVEPKERDQALAVWMERNTAHTTSYSHLSLDPRGVNFKTELRSGGNQNFALLWHQHDPNSRNLNPNWENQDQNWQADDSDLEKS
jgi:hypothetical protein